MIEHDSIFFTKDYGKISIKLKEIIDSKNITRNHLAKLVNTRFEVIDKWCNNDVSKIDLDILARICFVLKCEVSDIVKHVQNEKPTLK